MAAKITAANNKVFQADDVHISFEDQQKINRFAKHNARMDDLRMELELRKNELKSLDEALDELELFCDDEEIPFLIGEVFLNYKLDRTQELLVDGREDTIKDIELIELKVNELKAEMSELKAHLYQRFGSNISLESDD